jgi:hypothetical protein
MTQIMEPECAFSRLFILRQKLTDKISKPISANVSGILGNNLLLTPRDPAAAENVPQGSQDNANRDGTSLKDAGPKLTQRVFKV